MNEHEPTLNPFEAKSSASSCGIRLVSQCKQAQKITNLCVVKLWSKDVWQEQDSLVLGIVAFRCSDIAVNAADLLPFT